MKTKYAVSVALCAALLVTAGCSTTNPNPQFGPAMVQIAVETGTAFGVQKAPQAVPYLRVAAPIICAAAAATNIQPAQVVYALESSGLLNSTNVEAVLIANAALAIYDTVFTSFGTNWVANQPALQSYLQAICMGIELGLPSSVAMPSLPPVIVTQQVPPHLK